MEHKGLGFFVNLLFVVVRFCLVLEALASIVDLAEVMDLWGLGDVVSRPSLAAASSSTSTSATTVASAVDNAMVGPRSVFCDIGWQILGRTCIFSQSLQKPIFIFHSSNIRVAGFWKILYLRQIL